MAAHGRDADSADIVFRLSWPVSDLTPKLLSDLAIRRVALEGLAAVGDGETVPGLEAVLDRHRTPWAELALALARVGSRRARGAISALLARRARVLRVPPSAQRL